MTTRKLQTIEERGYSRPDRLVSTEWLEAHLDDPGIRVVESDEDVLLYDTGHIRGAVRIDWVADLNDPVRRDYIDGERMAALLSGNGISPATTIVLYGDRHNWWATYTYWVLKLFGHEDVRILDGGRAKWEADGRPFTTAVPSYAPTSYPTPERDDARIRVFRDDVLRHQAERLPLIDVRSPDEFTGRKLHMPEYPQEGALRGGHIPGARNVPWARAVDPETGEFRDAASLQAIYEGEAGLTSDSDVITYCRIGERSSHTWFVLTYLLGYDRVRNYDGSWTEWGNLVRAPIER
jgi:thiosulfate/3-mercaptopyruvate sulfurtransferase